MAPAVTDHYVTMPLDLDAVALRVALDYVERTYGRLVHLTGIISFPDGSVRIHGTAYPDGVEFSAYGRANGDCGE